MSMTSSVRRRPRDAGTSGPSGWSTGAGAVMLLTAASRRLAGPCPRSRGPRRGRIQRAGRDAVDRRQRARPARAGRLLARAERPRTGVGYWRPRVGGGAASGMLPLVRGHPGPVLVVGVFPEDPVLLRRVRGAAGNDGGADVLHRLVHLSLAARAARADNRLLVVLGDLVELDAGRLVRAEPAEPE